MAYEFDLPFQRRLLAAAWADPSWFRLHREVIRPEYFTDEVLGGVASALGRISGDVGGVADLAIVLEAVKSEVADGRKFDEYEAVVRRVFKSIKSENAAFYREKAVDFAKRAALLEAVSLANQAVQAGDLDKVQALIQRALRVGEGTSTRYYDLLAKAGERARVYSGDDQTERLRRVPTGFGPLDQATGGGLGPGEVGCFMGLPKHGKSTALVCVGKNALLSGRSVLHISLENSVSLTATKYDVALFGKPLQKLKKLPNRFQRVMSELASKLVSKLQISFFPTKSLTVSALESVIEGAGKTDLVLIDYAALLRPDSGKDEKRIQLVQVFEGLRRVAGESHVPIWTAHQANRPGVNAKVLGMEHMAECFEVNGIVDIGVSVNFDEARQAEVILSIMGSRIGPSGFNMDCSVDWETSTIKVLSDEV